MKHIQSFIILFIVIISLMLSGKGLCSEEWLKQGLSLLELKRFDPAIDAFTRVIELHPDEYKAYYHRGIAWFYKKDYDKAIADYNMTLKKNPDLVEALNSRGVAYFSKGNYESAIADYNLAMEKDPNNMETHNHLAWVLSVCPKKKYRNGEKALKLAQKLVEQAPGPYHMDTLAAAYAEVDRFSDAVSTQKNVIFMLMQSNQTEGLTKYVKRLKQYENFKPWREKIASSVDKGDIAKESELKQEKSPEASPAASKKTVATKEKKITDKKKKDDLKDKPAALVPVIKKKEPKEKKASSKKQTLEINKFFPYTIQVSSYPLKEKSNRIAKELKRKGDAAFTSHVFIPEKGDWHRIFIGHFENRKMAEIAAKQLKKRNFRMANIVRKPYAVKVDPKDQDLKKLETDLWAKGYLPYALSAGNNTGNMRVLIGAFESKSEAKRSVLMLKNDGFETEVVRR